MNSAKAAKLIRMLSSSNEGEVISAARALCRMGIHDVAERMEKGAETVIRYVSQPRRTRAAGIEIARLTALVAELQSELIRFNRRCCVVCDKPFVAGRADAS